MPARSKAYAASGVKTWQDLQAITGLGDDAIKAAIRSGEAPGYVIGDRYVIPADAFEDFKHGRWVPIHHTVLTEPLRALPEPSDMIRRKAS